MKYTKWSWTNNKPHFNSFMISIVAILRDKIYDILLAATEDDFGIILYAAWHTLFQLSSCVFRWKDDMVVKCFGWFSKILWDSCWFFTTRSWCLELIPKLRLCGILRDCASFLTEVWKDSRKDSSAVLLQSNCLHEFGESLWRITESSVENLSVPFTSFSLEMWSYDHFRFDADSSGILSELHYRLVEVVFLSPGGEGRGAGGGGRGGRRWRGGGEGGGDVIGGRVLFGFARCGRASILITISSTNCCCDIDTGRRNKLSTFNWIHTWFEVFLKYLSGRRSSAIGARSNSFKSSDWCSVYYSTLGKFNQVDQSCKLNSTEETFDLLWKSCYATVGRVRSIWSIPSRNLPADCSDIQTPFQQRFTSQWITR